MPEPKLVLTTLVNWEELPAPGGAIRHDPTALAGMVDPYAGWLMLGFLFYSVPPFDSDLRVRLLGEGYLVFGDFGVWMASMEANKTLPDMQSVYWTLYNTTMQRFVTARLSPTEMRQSS